MKKVTIGVLAFQGDVIEHIEATLKAAQRLKKSVNVIPLRQKEQVKLLDGLIIPGGESTTLYKLCEREGMFEQMKKIPFIFGTCAGAIMLAKTIHHKTKGQKTLERMDITVDRNAYGRQTESFEKDIVTSLGPLRAVFIRAPRINKVGKTVRVLAKNNSEVIMCEQSYGNYFNLAACFHPELTSTVFHQYFLKKIFTKN